MPPDLAVVRDVHHVVELGPLPDPRHPEGCPIHAGIGPNLHAIPNLHSPHLRKFFVRIAGQHKSEPVRPNHATRMQHDVFSDTHIPVNRDPRMQ